MKKTSLFLMLVSTIATLHAAPPAPSPTPPAPAATERKAFMPGQVWPDDKGLHINAHGGGILLHEGIYYWYGEHRIEGKKGFSAQVGVSVFASKDLYNWKSMGIALPVSEDPTSEIKKGCMIERPKVIYNEKTKKFVMWFHLELKGKGYAAARTALAVSDKPTGPFTYVGSLRPNAGVWPVGATEELKKAAKKQEGREGIIAGSKLREDFKGGQMSRDMTLFVDDDKKAYLITASEENQTLHIHELSDDYQKFSGKWTRVFPGDANEGPAIFKKDGKYYLITSACTGYAPNPGRSAVADSIWGPWTSLGNPCRGDAKQNATTFESQSTFILPAPGKPGQFIYMGDRWRPGKLIESGHIWLPIEWENDKPILKWYDSWDLSVFDKK